MAAEGCAWTRSFWCVCLFSTTMLLTCLLSDRLQPVLIDLVHELAVSRQLGAHLLGEGDVVADQLCCQSFVFPPLVYFGAAAHSVEHVLVACRREALFEPIELIEKPRR